MRRGQTQLRLRQLPARQDVDVASLSLSCPGCRCAWPGDGGGTVAVAKRKHRRNLSASAFSGTVGVAADEINKRNHNQDLSSHAMCVCMCVFACVCVWQVKKGGHNEPSSLSTLLSMPKSIWIKCLCQCFPVYLPHSPPPSLPLPISVNASHNFGINKGKRTEQVAAKRIFSAKKECWRENQYKQAAEKGEEEVKEGDTRL